MSGAVRCGKPHLSLLCVQDELLDELEELEQEDLEKEILDIPSVTTTLPDQEITGLPSVREWMRV